MERSATRVYYGWWLVVVLAIVTIVSYGTTQYLFGVLVVPVGHSLGTSRAQISSAYSIGLLVAGLLGIPVGRFVDRYGARRVLLAGSLLGAASLLGLSRAHSLLEFWVLWSGGMGLAMGLTLYPVTFVVVANWFERRRGSAMALLTTLGGLSSPIFIPLAGWLIVSTGWRTALLLLSLTQLALLPLEAILVRRQPEDLGLLPDGRADAPAMSTPLAGTSAGEALRQPAFWTLTVAGSAGLLAATALQVHQVPYMISRGVDPVLAASIAGVTGIASLPGRVLLNLLGERIPAHVVLAAAFAVVGAGVLMLSVARSAPLFAVCAAVYGIGYGAVSPLRATAMADRFGRRAYGAITAVQNVAVTFCSAAGPIVAGDLYDRAHDYFPALLAIIAGSLVAALAAVVTPPVRPPG